MGKILIAKRLNPPAHLRIIAPARSLAFIKQDIIPLAQQRLEDTGFTISFGEHVYERDSFDSSSIKSRVDDIHAAFSDSTVDGILTVLGGYTSNQLLKYLDYDLIAANPKVICGYSDITSILNGIYAKTGLITYLGPHFTSWGMKYGFNYSLEYFIKCCSEKLPYELLPSEEWSDDTWFKDQENRPYIRNEGYWVIREGKAIGTIYGGNISTYVLNAGTEYERPLHNAILFLEATSDIHAQSFAGLFESFMNRSYSSEIKAIVIGRFHNISGITPKLLEQIFLSHPELSNIPIVANVDFGHTTPNATIPIGGTCEVKAIENSAKITILTH